MAPALQNRLVGTIIIVALAVIFLPDFLDGEKAKNVEQFSSVPSAPARKPIVQPESFPTARAQSATQRPVEVVSEPVVDDPKPVRSNTQNDSVEDNDLARQTVVEHPASKTENAGWVIQMGSFRHQKNVQQLLQKLESAGYRAFSRPIQTNSGSLTKVFIGPDLDKKKLEVAVPHLKELTGLKGRVTEFTVE